MKRIMVLLAVMTTGYVAHAQERAPLEEARKVAKLVVETTGEAANLPVKIELDLEKPQVFKANKAGVLVIPGKTLSEKIFEKLGKEIVPVGDLWMLKLVPQVNGKSATNEQLRRVAVKTDEKTFDLTCYQLGVQKNDKEAIELVVFGKDKKPLVTVPLEKNQATQELPIELDGRKQDEGTGVLTLNVLGKYKAEVTVGIEE